MQCGNLVRRYVETKRKKPVEKIDWVSWWQTTDRGVSPNQVAYSEVYPILPGGPRDKSTGEYLDAGYEFCDGTIRVAVGVEDEGDCCRAVDRGHAQQGIGFAG